MSQSHSTMKSFKKGVCMPCVRRNAEVGPTMMNVTCKSSGPPPLVANHSPSTFSRSFLLQTFFWLVSHWHEKGFLKALFPFPDISSSFHCFLTGIRRGWGSGAKRLQSLSLGLRFLLPAELLFISLQSL